MLGLLHLAISLLSFVSYVAAHPTSSPDGHAALDRRQSNNCTLSLIHEFPEGTWVENIAVRANGQLLVTLISAPRLYLIDPDPANSSSATLLHEFSDAASLLGITEGIEDVFYVVTANFSATTLQGYGDAYVYEVDLRGYLPDAPDSAIVSKVASLPQAKALNGLAYFSDQRDVLFITDFLAGVIWSVDPKTGSSEVFVNNTFTQTTGFGANGLKIEDSVLYFTNSQQQSLVKVPLDSDGRIDDDFVVVTQGGFSGDDFAVDDEGNFFIATFIDIGYTVGEEGVLFVPKNGQPNTYVVTVPGPTSCAFGRSSTDRGVLYITTSGGDSAYVTSGPVTVSGKVFKLDVAECSV